MNNIDDIFKFIIILILIYIIYEIYNIKNEKFDATSDATNAAINTAVKKIYLADVEAIRILSNFAIQLSQGGFTVPGDTMVTGNLYSNSIITNRVAASNLDGNQIELYCKNNNWLFNNSPSDEYNDNSNLNIRGQKQNGEWTDTYFEIKQNGNVLIKKQLTVNDIAEFKNNINLTGILKLPNDNAIHAASDYVRLGTHANAYSYKNFAVNNLWCDSNINVRGTISCNDVEIDKIYKGTINNATLNINIGTVDYFVICHVLLRYSSVSNGHINFSSATYMITKTCDGTSGVHCIIKLNDYDNNGPIRPDDFKSKISYTFPNLTINAAGFLCSIMAIKY